MTAAALIYAVYALSTAFTVLVVAVLRHFIFVCRVLMIRMSISVPPGKLDQIFIT